MTAVKVCPGCLSAAGYGDIAQGAVILAPDAAPSCRALPVTVACMAELELCSVSVPPATETPHRLVADLQIDWMTNGRR